MTEEELKLLNASFDEYMTEYKKLPIENKRDELVSSVKMLIANIELLAKMDNIELHYLTSREILDLKNKPLSEDDFLEAMLAYIETIKNLIGEYLILKEK